MPLWPPARWEAADHVLARFSPSEVPEVDQLLQKGLDALEDILERGLTPAMNRFNAPPGAASPSPVSSRPDAPRLDSPRPAAPGTPRPPIVADP